MRESLHPAQANRLINNLIARPELPLCIFHDHLIGQPGGLAIFEVRDLAEIDELLTAIRDLLPNWRSELRPLIFSYNPAAFDEQIAYTQSAYRHIDWAQLRLEKRPAYCDPLRETEAASDGS